jgi:rubrerythrin
MKKTITFVVCKKCGYEWIPRVANPKKCPSCQTRTSKRKGA